MIRCYGCMELYEDNETHTCPSCGYCQDSKPAVPIHIQPGSVLADRYIIGNVKGFGGFGVTYLAWDTKMNVKVAIKEYLPSEFSTRSPGQTQVTVFSGDKKEQYSSGMTRFINEAKNLARFTSCTGIVKVYDSFCDNDTAYIVMEYLDGITLKEFLSNVGTIEPEDAVDMMLPIMRSLETVNKEGIIHRDIAPDNIMVTHNGGFKLIDFGAARYATTSHSRSLSVLIKQGFSPEEQYTSHGEQGPHTDVYAMGATLYKMITGITPPEALARRAELETKGRDILEPLSKYCKDIPENIENAIINAMNVKAEDRTPDMGEFIHELTTDDVVKLRKNSIRIIDIYRWPLWLKITVPTLAVSVIALITLFMTGVIGFKSNLESQMYTPDGMVRVPSVVNYSIDEAEELLKEKCLTYVVKDKMYSDVVEKDKILSQSTIAGSLVGENSKLDIVICGGIETVEMPSVKGRESDEVIAELKEMGFVVNISEEYSDVIAKGSVIDIEVKYESDGTVAKNSTIIVIISKGVDPSKERIVEKRQVPDFVGHTQEEAVDLATSAGFMLKYDYSYSADILENVVMLQSEEAGKQVDTDVVIVLTVSLGANLAKVPDVQYKEESVAKNEITAKGLKCEIEYIESDNVSAGHVISQSIAAGEKVAPETVVKLVVSLGAGKIDVPNVSGKTEAEAKNILTTAGFVIVSTYENSSTVADGVVISQNIVGEKKASKGDTITLNISSGKALTTVPNVVGITRGEAETAIKNAGLSVVVVERTSTDVAKGNVISQSIQSGTSVMPGSTITLDISSGLPRVNVPQIIGSDKASAISAVENAGLVCSISDETNDSVEAGKVIRTSPSGGSDVEYGSTVSVVVSSGPGYVTVSFDGNGGNVSSGSMQVVVGRSLGSMPAASRDYYTFSGWYTSADGGSQVDSGTAINDGMTLYAHWNEKLVSGWVTADQIPAGASVVNTKNQYRYSTKETTESENAELSGYTQYGSYQVATGTYTYSDWSGWSDTLAQESDTLEVNSKQQYSYRDKERTTKKNDSSAPSGYSLEKSETKEGEWNANETSTSGPPAENATTKVEVISTSTITKYRYHHWRDKDYKDPAGYVSPRNYNNSYYNHTIESDYAFEANGSTHLNSGDYTKYYGDACSRCGWTGPWYEPETTTITTTVYRTKEIYTEYTFWRWGNWSGWSDIQVSASGDREVNTKTVYQTRTKTADLKTIYQYYRWSDFSDWSDATVSSSDTVNVETRELYQYREK